MLIFGPWPANDLLVAECEALATLGKWGLPAAETRCLDGARYRLLESRRFDRVGHAGRASLLSLEAVNAEYGDTHGTWLELADALVAAGRLEPDDRARIVWLQLFGTWIGNTEMHAGNLALAPEGHGFRLLPAYDAAPMRFAPVRGAVAPMDAGAIHPPVMPRHGADAWQTSGEAAARFWEGLTTDARLTAAFRALAAGCSERITAILRE